MFAPTNPGYRILFLLVACSYWTAPAYAQLPLRHVYKKRVVQQIVPQFQVGVPEPEFDLTPEMLGMLQYAQTLANPVQRQLPVEHFIRRYIPYSDNRMMKNGDIAYLRHYYNKYLETLESFNSLADEFQSDYSTSRRQFFRTNKITSKKERRRTWRNMTRLRYELVRNFFIFQEYILPALSTEIALILQERHFPELAVRMNQLTNLDGSPLPVTVFSNKLLQVSHHKNAQISGLSIISKCDNVYTSGSPAVRKTYPGLRGSNKGLTVHLQMFENGVTLSHELGHLYYLYHKWEEYVEYIERKGKDYEPGGHGPDDPSGRAAHLTEQGLLPFE